MTFESPYNRETSYQRNKLMFIFPKVVEKIEKSHNSKENIVKMKLDHIKSIVKFQRAVDNKDVFFLENIKKLILLLRNDVFKLTSERINNRIWRNISKMVIFNF